MKRRMSSSVNALLKLTCCPTRKSSIRATTMTEILPPTSECGVLPPLSRFRKHDPPILRIKCNDKILKKPRSEVADRKLEEVETRIRQHGAADAHRPLQRRAVDIEWPASDLCVSEDLRLRGKRQPLCRAQRQRHLGRA